MGAVETQYRGWAQGAVLPGSHAAEPAAQTFTSPPTEEDGAGPL